MAKIISIELDVHNVPIILDPHSRPASYFLTPMPAAMDPTELNFEIEYQKQFSRQALFEDIAKHSWSKTCAPRFCSAAIHDAMKLSGRRKC
jgi:hypothetical protein